MDYSRKALADALAAEYVAGTLRGPARRRFETLLAAHPALRAAVADWQARLMPLTGAVAPVAPPARVWAGIETRLWPVAAPAPHLPWWQRLAPWRALSALALAAVVGLAVFVAQPVAVPPPPVVVVLQSTGQAPEAAGSVVASFSGDGRAVVARPIVPVGIRPDRVLELWWARESGPPASLGLIRADGVTVLRPGAFPKGLAASGIDHMAVSVEPPGGSPTGQPTGPVVYFGKLQL